MADPVTLMMVSAGMSAAGGAVGAFGSIFGGEAQKNMYNYQAGVAQANAKLFQQNANIAYDVGERRAQIAGLHTGQEVGAQRAGAGEGNLNPNVGSSAQVQSSQIAAGRITQQNIRYTAAQSAFGEKVKAFGEEATAGLDITAGKTAMAAGEISAVGSILGAGTSVADKWSQAAYMSGPRAGPSSIYTG